MTDAGKRFLDAVKAGQVECFSVDPDNPALAYDPMPLESEGGDRVRFTGYGGYESQQEHARKFLTVDAVYTVRHMEVGGWSSSVELVEVPGEFFNSVMFAAAE